MIVLKILLYLLSLLLPGFFTVQLFGIRKISLLNLALYFGAGAYFVAIQIFIWMFLFRAPFNFTWFYVLWFFETAALFLIFFYFKKDGFFYVEVGRIFSFWSNITKNHTGKSREKNNSGLLSRLKIILIILIFFQIFTLGALTVTRPNVTYDNLSLWLYDAKVMYFQNSVNFNPDKPDFLGAIPSHTNYPRLLPISVFWFSQNIGYYSDSLVNLVFLFYFLFLAGIIYSFAREKIGQNKSLWLILFLVNFPLLSYHAYNGYADLTLSFYLAVSFILFLKWLEKEEINYLLWSGGLLGMAMFVKNDAIIFMPAFLAILFIINKKILEKIKYIVIFLLSTAILISPWLFFMVKHGLGFSNTGNNKFVVLGWHPEILASFANTMFASNNWGLWWYLLLAVLIISLRKFKYNKLLIYSWVFVGVYLICILAIYLFTPEYLYALDNTALSRNLLVILPITFVAFILSIKENDKTRIL
jgi:4-amino-4-deoxy-L-arabinose transferase-like glycosyltransferase